jgi:hypothetical protein
MGVMVHVAVVVFPTNLFSVYSGEDDITTLVNRAEEQMRLSNPHNPPVSIDVAQTMESFFAYYFSKLHLHHFSKIKSHKNVTKQ